MKALPFTPSFLTTTQAAKRVGITVGDLVCARLDGRVPYLTIGSEVRYPAKALDVLKDYLKGA